jgi:AraC-like DNA-binding protein
VLQEIKFEEFMLSFFQFEFIRKKTVIAKLPAGIQSLFSEKGKSSHRLADLARMELHSSQFILFNKTDVQWEIEVPELRPVQLIHISYSSNFYEDLFAAFPGLKMDENLTIPKSFCANNLIRDTAHQILHASYEPRKLPFYFKNKVGEFLFLLLEQASIESGNKILQPTVHEKKALYKVRDLILADVLQHHVISDIAKKVKMNQYRLKYFFKQEFGVGPYKFLLNARMDKAKELIDNGKPMKEAVSLAGYTTTSFITAFRKRYGYTPGSVKRKSGELKSRNN